MANLQITTKIIGDGIIRFASGSQFIVAADINGSGIYMPNVDNDYKFFLTGKLLKIVTLAGTILSSSVDNSITVVKGSADANFEVYFTPVSQYDNIMIEKETTTTSVGPIISDSLILNVISASVPTPGYSEPTDADYRRGYMYRYFYKQVNNPSSIVRETAEYQFSSISKYYLYKALKIKWKIIGPESIAKQTNTLIALESEKTLPGITSVLSSNYLSHWKNLPDVVPIIPYTVGV